jgi:hypothetical protein
MSSTVKNGFFPESDRYHPHDTGEDTLRLIAGLPAPEGLADRVQSGLRNASQTANQTGRVLRWRAPLTSPGGWMHSTVARGAAAAAIVCVVAGGGWTVYSRVSPPPAARVLVMPPRAGGNTGGFAPAGAKHVPETLQGPVLTHSIANTPDQPVADKGPAAPRQAAPRAVPRKKAAPGTGVAPVR